MIDATASGSPTLSVDAEGVGFLTFDDPGRPVNVLSEATMRRLAERVAEVEERAGKDIRVLVIRSGKPHTFIAGADLDEIEEIEDPADGEAKSRLGQAVYLDIERLPIPTVAAIDGLCLGGEPNSRWPAAFGSARTTRRPALGSRRSNSACSPDGVGRPGFPG